MARFNLSDEMLTKIAAQMADAGCDDMDGEFADTDLIVCTDTPLADWVAAHGAPTESTDGAHYWQGWQKTGRRGAPIFVVEIPQGTAAFCRDGLRG